MLTILPFHLDTKLGQLRGLEMIQLMLGHTYACAMYPLHETVLQDKNRTREKLEESKILGLSRLSTKKTCKMSAIYHTHKSNVSRCGSSTHVKTWLFHRARAIQGTCKSSNRSEITQIKGTVLHLHQFKLNRGQ